MTDLTKNTTPFGLLDAETQEALQAHGGPYEFYDGEWDDTNPPQWNENTVYRVKTSPPAPPKPREFWVTYDTRGKIGVMDKPIAEDGFHEIIHVREVLPE